MSDHSTDTEGSDDPPDIDGMRVQRAVGELLEYDSSLQAEQVYGLLQTIATRTESDEGPQATVTREAAEEELERLSTAITAAKTRVESAEEELEAALEAAGEERGRGVVQHRLDGFAARLDTVQREVNQVGGRLRELTAEDEDLFAVARGIVGLEHQANDLQGRAGDLQLDLEEFGTWVSNPSTRFEELDGDLNALEESLEGLETGSATTGGPPGSPRSERRSRPNWMLSRHRSTGGGFRRHWGNTGRGSWRSADRGEDDRRYRHPEPWLEFVWGVGETEQRSRERSVCSDQPNFPLM